jgi:hypothetical protein
MEKTRTSASASYEITHSFQIESTIDLTELLPVTSCAGQSPAPAKSIFQNWFFSAEAS